MQGRRRCCLAELLGASSERLTCIAASLTCLLTAPNSMCIRCVGRAPLSWRQMHPLYLVSRRPKMTSRRHPGLVYSCCTSAGSVRGSNQAQAELGLAHERGAVQEPTFGIDINLLISVILNRRLPISEHWRRTQAITAEQHRLPLCIISSA